jgi:hypothetical protein
MAGLQTDILQCLEKSRAAEFRYRLEVSASPGKLRIGVGLDSAALPAIVMFGEKRNIV